MPDYFSFGAKDVPGTAVAYTVGGTPLSHALIPEVRAKSELPFDLTLKKVRFGKDGTHVSDDLSELKNVWVDYQPNNLAWPLWSEKLTGVSFENASVV